MAGVSNIKGAEKVVQTRFYKSIGLPICGRCFRQCVRRKRGQIDRCVAWKERGEQNTSGIFPAAGTAALNKSERRFRCGQTHAVAVARNNLLNFLLLGARMDAKKAGALGVKKAASGYATSSAITDGCASRNRRRFKVVAVRNARLRSVPMPT